ncbi:MAG: hypothetical protein IJ415_02265 [Clostridia bacterium]|nr:hypothetical protein [Clostridia bacterium]
MLSIVFSFDLTLIGLILGIIGLVKGIKSKDKISIILNSIGIVLSVAFSIIYTIQVVSFIQALNSLVS